MSIQHYSTALLHLYTASKLKAPFGLPNSTSPTEPRAHIAAFGPSVIAAASWVSALLACLPVLPSGPWIPVHAHLDGPNFFDRLPGAVERAERTLKQHRALSDAFDFEPDEVEFAKFPTAKVPSAHPAELIGTIYQNKAASLLPFTLNAQQTIYCIALNPAHTQHQNLFEHVQGLLAQSNSLGNYDQYPHCSSADFVRFLCHSFTILHEWFHAQEHYLRKHCQRIDLLTPRFLSSEWENLPDTEMYRLTHLMGTGKPFGLARSFLAESLCDCMAFWALGFGMPRASLKSFLGAFAIWRQSRTKQILDTESGYATFCHFSHLSITSFGSVLLRSPMDAQKAWDYSIDAAYRSALVWIEHLGHKKAQQYGALAQMMLLIQTVCQGRPDIKAPYMRAQLDRRFGLA